jgi:hypothetical protein
MANLFWAVAHHDQNRPKRAVHDILKKKNKIGGILVCRSIRVGHHWSRMMTEWKDIQDS